MSETPLANAGPLDGSAAPFASMTGAISRTWSDGMILVEGLVQRVEECIGIPALDRLVELLNRDGPSSIARAEGDFVALVKSRTHIHAFKSFTSQYQIYYREGERLIANRLFAFWNVTTGEWDEDYFA